MIASRPATLLNDALDVVDRAIPQGTLSRRKLPLREAAGETLAADQLSRLELPPFDKAAMDGYAVLEGDRRDRYQVLETVAAGSTPAASLRPGTAVKVMTGTPVPAGAGQVIPIEHVRSQAGGIEVTRPTDRRNICPQGEDVRAGDVVLRAGARLGPLAIANLISCGITEVEVFRPLRLAVFSTGDEIVDDPRQLGPGKIMNTNGPMLALLGRRFSMDVVTETSLPDDRQATAAAVAAATGRADLVVLSGGVSVGDRDFVGQALADAAFQVHFTSVAVKPGRPLTFATRPGTAVFGLPGNPVSVYVMFHVFVRRAAARFCGSPWPAGEIPLRLGCDFRRRQADRVEYVPCRIGDDAAVAPLEFHGSAHLAALLAADGLLVVPAGISLLPAGQLVRFVPFTEGWR
ncbi:MAG: molybdopterin molybdotransferase MoeA [Thermoguttaceae bacterium]